MRVLKRINNYAVFGVKGWYLLVFVLIGTTLAYTSAPIINPDGIEYTVIAHHYAALDFNAAINGIWSPLLSWLLVIPILAGIDPFLFFRLTLVMVGLALLIVTRKLLYYWLNPERQPIDRYVAAAITIFMSLFSFYAIACTPITSDFFSVFFLVIWLLFLSRYHRKPSIGGAVLVGSAVGAGYYAKNYFLYFGVAAISIYFFYRLILNHASKKRVVSHGILALLACLLMVLPWIIAMDYKYHKPTLNPIGEYALSQVGPHYPGPPVLTLGLLSPPHTHSVTAREDPTSFDYIPWGPTKSWTDSKYYIAHIVPKNILDGIKILFPILIVLVIALFSLLHESRKKIVSGLYNFKFIGLTIGSAIYTGGYCLVHIEGGFRYLWPAYIMLSLVFFFLVPHLNKNLRMYMLIIGTVILSLYPIVTNVQSTIGSIRTSREARQLSQDIKRETNIKPGSHIASNEPYAAANICYFNELKCYGLPKKSRVEEQLRVFKINYVFNFKNHTPLPVSGQRIFENKELVILKLSATNDW